MHPNINLENPDDAVVCFFAIYYFMMIMVHFSIVDSLMY